MKKRIIRIGIVVIFIIIISVSVIYINTFPLAKPIKLPLANEVNVVEIDKDNLLVKYTNNEEITEILNILSGAKPTRIMTVHDRPMVRDYYTLNLNTMSEDWVYRIFIYNKNSMWYIEQPYIGVYELKKGLVDFLSYIEPLK
ncbi:MAG: DUF5301 domain-containing protein [Epulopiscium sp.]|nr:DUF5301 domain-containing protein [Candidatus Epulonipiscium sp.]